MLHSQISFLHTNSQYLQSKEHPEKCVNPSRASQVSNQIGKQQDIFDLSSSGRPMGQPKMLPQQLDNLFIWNKFQI